MDGFMIIFMVTINVLDCNGISLRVQLEDLLGIDRDGQEYSDEYQLAGGGQGSLSESDASESRQDADVNEFYGGSQENTDKHSDYSNEYQNSQEVDLPEYKEYDKPIGRVLKVREFTDDHGTVWKKHKHERMPSLQSRTRFSQQSLSPLTHKVQANGVEIQFVDLHRGQRQDMYGRTLGPKMSNVNPGMNVQVGQVRNGYEKNRYPTQERRETKPPNTNINQHKQGTRFKFVKSDRPEKRMEHVNPPHPDTRFKLIKSDDPENMNIETDIYENKPFESNYASQFVRGIKKYAQRRAIYNQIERLVSKFAQYI